MTAYSPVLETFVDQTSSYASEDGYLFLRQPEISEKINLLGIRPWESDIYDEILKEKVGILRFAGKWIGNDIDDCLRMVNQTRS